MSSNARICRAPLEAVEKLCLKIPGLKAGDQLIFGFAIYRVGNLIDLKNVGRNHVNFDVTVTLGSMDSISDRLLDVLESTSMKYKEEIAISNRVLVVGRENSMVREFNMAFIDYKSGSYDAVSAAKNRNKRFQEAILLKTDASFHAYGPPMPNKASPRNETVATTVLTQREVIDVDWAMICILRGESYLRVSHNVKGDIVKAVPPPARRIDLDSLKEEGTLDADDGFTITITPKATKEQTRDVRRTY